MSLIDFSEEDFDYFGIIYLKTGIKINVLIQDPDSFLDRLNSENNRFLNFFAKDKKGNKLVYLDKNDITSISIFPRSINIEE
jgi:hypothetical protein